MEKERLKYCIDRFDHYYDSVNNKSSVFLGLSTFIVGGLVAGYFTIGSFVNCGFWSNAIIIVLIGLGVATMITVVIAATPFLSKDVESLHFFGAIACKDSSFFCVKSAEPCTDEDELKDLRNQVYQLATGLKGKFMKLKIAGIMFTIQFCLFIPLFIIIICNLK
ncbi:hypothetical protein [Olivibacter domesticus]|uniref:Pycsar effector protein domain-containing protein n=1 Tax=Olivibacter domesticus TaxID=407022 RepID=A0A1H7JNK4_OLID1|nr:hypothetical protein [Olivibacter domesticus]SEK76263.1 hypothetical protein SAMN05661044_01081 [Olivibacter domesticus]